MSLISFELPFHIGMADEPTNGAFPGVLPFAAGVRSDLGLLIQLPDPRVVEELNRVYRRGSMLGTPLSAEGLGRSYADDFLGFIRESVPRQPTRLGLLEIGCGSGYLLGRMRQLGADVIGVEPGPQAALGRAEHDVQIIQQPFLGPEQFGGRRFDVILHHCVLEHVPDPVGFLNSQRQMLNPGGRLLLGVPDEEPYILSGDISTLAHQHWSYFTKGSLAAILAASGFRVARIASAGFGGAMYAVAEPSAPHDRGHEWTEVARFADAARGKVAALGKFFAEMSAAGRTVGLWPGARAVNYLHVLRSRMPVRLFDDDGLLTGKYYPPVPVPVESRAQLLARPVDELVMLTRAFGTKLRSELQAAPQLERTTIRLFDEIR